MFRLLIALRWLAMGLIVAAIIFGCAGRIDLPGVWGVLGTLVAFGLVMSATADIGLLRERVRPAAKSHDRVTQPVSLVMMLSQWVIAGLDARYGLSPIPLPIVIAGIVGYAAALAVVLWAMYANPFYSSVVRVQSDRGQTPIARGPYSIVRHPGYAASMLAFVAGGPGARVVVGDDPDRGGFRPLPSPDAAGRPPFARGAARLCRLRPPRPLSPAAGRDLTSRVHESAGGRRNAHGRRCMARCVLRSRHARLMHPIF